MYQFTSSIKIVNCMFSFSTLSFVLLLSYIISTNVTNSIKHCYHFCFKQWPYFFKSSFRFTGKLRGRYRHFSYSPCPHTCVESTVINFPHQSEMFVTTDESTLTCHYHTKSIIYHRMHSWCYRLYSLGQMYNECINLSW